MRKKHVKKRILAGLLGAAVLCSSLSLPALASPDTQNGGEDYTQYVDPFVGTQVDNGQQFPGAVSPYGIVKLSPDTYPHTNDVHAGYDYKEDQIAGFSHTRVEGVGGQGAGGDVLVTPTYVQYTEKPSMESRAQSFTHEKESAAPGYYQVDLTPNTGLNDGTADTSMGTIQAEMTATTRTGVHKYTFPQAGEVSIVTDLNYTYHGTDIRDAILDISETEEGNVAMSGRFSGRNVSGHGKYTMYFYLETDTPAADVHTWNGDSYGTLTSLSGNDLGAVLSFQVEAGQSVQVKVAISPISSEQAKIDMEAENPGWDFGQIREQARADWNELLGRVDIESSATSDPDGSLKKLFYTHLYRMFLTPVNATSTSGTYRGTDGQVYQAEGYTHYDSWTLWDDFRKYPVIGLIAPDVYKDIIQSVADMLVTGIETWGHDNQPVLTVRNEHAVALLADGVAKGYTDIKNLESAYEAAKAVANNAVNSQVESQGYFTGRVDQTVEYAYDDWCLSLIAASLGKTDEAEYYLERSFSYKNLYKSDAVTADDGSSVGLLWPKDSSGNWMSAEPERYGDNGLYQGTLWQYTWWDTNDVGGLMELMGGQENMLKALNILYGAKGEDADGHDMLHSNTNEIDLQTPYLFNFAGKPSETQYWVRQIYTGYTWNRYSGTGEYDPPQYTKVYKLAPDGLLTTMDDDAGTMAAMYVSAAMGIFPMTPGDSTFQIGTPFFEKMTLELGNGKTFVINAQNVSPDNYYIQSASLNGGSLDRTWLDYSEIAQGGEVTFVMGAEPSAWAEDGALAPSSSDEDPASAYDYTLTYDKDSLDVQDGTVQETLTATLEGGASFSGEVADITAEGLPEGLSLSAERKDAQTLELTVSGTITDIGSEYETYDVQIMMGDSVFGDGIKASQVENAVMGSMAAIRLKNTMNPTGLTVQAPSQTDYTVGDLLNPEGGSVTVDYTEEGLTRTLPLDSEELTVDALPAQAGDGQQVKVSYRGAEGYFTVNMKEQQAAENSVVLEYSFVGNENGTVKDEGPNGYDGTLKNGASTASGSLVLDNSQKQYLDIPAGAFGGLTGDAAISAWVYLDSASNNQMLLGAGADKNNFFVFSTNDVIRSGLNIGGAGELRMAADSGAPTGEWVYLTYVQEGESAALYQNGTRIATGSANGSLSRIIMDGSFIRLGGMDFWGDPYTDGKISSFTVYNRALTEEEIRSEQARTDNRLEDTLAEAEALLEQGGFSAEITRELQAAVDEADAVNRYAGASEEQIGQALDALQAAIDRAESSISGGSGSAYDRIEAEKMDDWSGGALKTETSQDNTSGGSVGNVGGTYNGGWLKYEGLNFGSAGADTLTVRYVNNSSRCGNNSRVDVYLDSMDGEPAVSADIPANAGNWNEYTSVTVEIPAAITGVHDVYVVMHTEQANAGYVANFDWFQFTEKPNADEIHLEAEAYSSWSKADGNDLKTENSTDSQGGSLTNLGGTYDGAWLGFEGVDFGENGMTDFAIRYVNNSSRCGNNNRVEIYLDSREGSPVQTVSIPVTGNNWNAYEELTAALDEKITGVHDVYFVLRTDGGNGNYVANIDWFGFSRNASKEELAALVAEGQTCLDEKDQYVASDIQKLEAAMEQAEAVLTQSEPVAEDIQNAIDALNQAIGRLHRVVDKTALAGLLEQAAAVDTAHWTEESRARLEEAVTYGQQVNGDENATEAAVAMAERLLEDAIANAEEAAEGDKVVLNAQISQGSAIGPTGYTEESYAVLQTALEEARIVTENRWATQELINETVQAVKTAVAGLAES
jgi:predicted alpha-1,2-mannosidase